MKTPGEGTKTAYASDVASAVIHILGAALSVAALTIIVVQAAQGRSAAFIVGSSLYGACIVYFFLISSLSHLLRPSGARRVFSILDEAGVYFLMAGSWTPLCFSVFAGPLGWGLLAALWSLALLFFAAAITLMSTARDRLIYVYYIGIACILPFVPPFKARLEEALFLWLVLAGLLYLAGLLFRSREDNPYNHAIWHAFTLAASICHFFGLLGLG